MVEAEWKRFGLFICALVIAYGLGYLSTTTRDESEMPLFRRTDQNQLSSSSYNEFITGFSGAVHQALRELSRASRYAKSQATRKSITEAFLKIFPVSYPPIELDRPDACPEVFMGTIYGYPFFEEGYLRNSCITAAPLPKLVTVLLVDDNAARLQTILQQINEMQPAIHTHIITRAAGRKAHFHNEVIFKRNDQRISDMLNSAVKSSKTKYILFARAVELFDVNMKLERLVDILSTTPNTIAVGGSSRNSTGHWRMGCFQSSMDDSAYKLIEGYELSHRSCPFCDFLAAPFLARRKDLLQYPFRAYDDAELAFLDLFERWKTDRRLSLVCPDSMFHSVEHSSMLHSSYGEAEFASFGTLWNVSNITLPYTPVFSMQHN